MVERAEMGFLNRDTSTQLSRRDDFYYDRRRVCRSRPVMRDMVLSWDKDQTIVQFPIWLENLSLHGCLVKSATRPALKPGEFLRVVVPGFEPVDGTEAILIESRKPVLRKCSIRIKFLLPLPYETFRFLVFGPEHHEMEQRILLDYETDQFWK
jgi:hypothetical protein